MKPSRDQPQRPRQSARLSRYLISEMLLPSLYAVVVFGLVVLMTDLLGVLVRHYLADLPLATPLWARVVGFSGRTAGSW